MVIDSKCSGVVHVFAIFFRVCTFKYQHECQAEYSRLILQLRNAKLGPTDQFLMTQLCVGTFLADTRQINILPRNTKKQENVILCVRRMAIANGVRDIVSC